MNRHEIRTVRCANCGTVRGECNHWFVVEQDSDELFGCGPLTIELIAKGLGEFDLPACGAACAQKLFEKFLSGQDLYAEPGNSRASASKTPVPY